MWATRSRPLDIGHDRDNVELIVVDIMAIDGSNDNVDVDDIDNIVGSSSFLACGNKPFVVASRRLP